MAQETTRGKGVDRIRIDLPENYDQPFDDSVWEDLEVLLYQGFLVSHADIQNKHFVFKTLNHLELRSIDLMRMGSSKSEDSKLRFRASFIAHSVLMADGVNVLWERPKHINRLIKLFMNLNSKVQEKIIENLAVLNDRSTRCYPLTEVYVHENRSRYRWNQYKNSQLNSSTVTGIHGTELIGMNQCQLTWVALNHFIDKKDEIERDWANAKFIGGCMAGKGMRSLDDRDRARLEREKSDILEKKVEVLKSYLNRTIGVELPKNITTLPDGRVAEVVTRNRAESAQELKDQLTAALNNEKDAHDLIVEQHFQKAKARNIEIEMERRKLLSRATKTLSQNPDGGSEFISKNDAESRVKRLQDIRINYRDDISPGSEASDTNDKDRLWQEKTYKSYFRLSPNWMTEVHLPSGKISRGSRKTLKK